jgi:hypothetical protein
MGYVHRQGRRRRMSEYGLLGQGLNDPSIKIEPPIEGD